MSAAALGAGNPVAATVRTPTASYDVLVARGLLDTLGGICRDLGLGGRAFIITDDALGPLFASRAEAALRAAGYAAQSFAIAAGEAHKTLASVERVYDWLIANRIERKDFAVCLGGGVVTDLGGFAASTVLRGIDFVHVPTSLLAMVDASIGGKTGVDHPRGKNLIGAFVQPRAVVIDPSLLETLPDRHRKNGWAEVIKHGFILDATLTADLEAAAGHADGMLDASLIARSTAIKAAVVSEDEREAGRRTLLNYGHTTGHAIESVTGYDKILHGEAVAIGMRVAGLMAVELGVLAPAAFARQQALIRACGLPESAPGVDLDAVLEATLQDKKVEGGAVRWVLLRDIGEAYVHGPIAPELVRRAVETVLRP
jgi:3-dehydroquinate synthase